MKKSVGFCEFTDAFTNMDRRENFSYDWLKALYEYLEQFEEDIWEEIELDIISICCEYSEYADIKEAYTQYQDDYMELGEDEEEREEKAKEYLQDNTQVIEFEGGIIIQDF